MGRAADKSTRFDVQRARGVLDQFRQLERDGHDIVFRCNEVCDFLIIRNDEQKMAAFYAAAAELELKYQASRADLKILLEAYFERTAMKPFIGSGGLASIFNRPRFTEVQIKTIISIAYPWFNHWLYLDFLRIDRGIGLDLASFSYIQGRYRYGRAFPHTDGKVEVTTGFLDIEHESSVNMICFGHRRSSTTNTRFEHRGFVFPTNRRVDLLSFRDNAIRLASIHGDLQDRAEGIILTSARPNGRPFAARFQIERVPSDGKLDPFDQDTFCKQNSANVYPEWGFVWGSKAESLEE